MPDKFDPYREALVVETNTIWPSRPDESTDVSVIDVSAIDVSVIDVSVHDKQQIANALHSDPEKAVHLEYVRTHTGFCRQITVQPEDVDRLRS